MIKKILSILEQDHKPTMLELLKDYTPFQMLVATLLSSRTKDSTTIPIVKRMFKKWKTAEDFLKVSDEELEKELFGIGFYKVKTKNIKKLSKILIEKFDNKVPNTLEELTSLPGVGRKTANCILAYTFGKPAIAVDVHVFRISNRLGLVKTKTPEETEVALKRLVPKELWIKVNSMLVGHGQTICSPIKPKCSECNVREYCEYGQSLTL